MTESERPVRIREVLRPARAGERVVATLPGIGPMTIAASVVAGSDEDFGAKLRTLDLFGAVAWRDGQA